MQEYKSYARDTGSYLWVGIIAVLLLCGQAANVANVLFLGYWSANSIEGFSQGECMAVYSGEAIGVLAKPGEDGGQD
jgi:hypothetical protein